MEALAITPLTHPLAASVHVPGSKSYTNRALLAAALAHGPSELRGALFSDDTRYMAAALNQLGIHVEAFDAERRFTVVGASGVIPDVNADLFVGNAGTAARFLTAMLALGKGRYRLDGVPRMRERPMADLVKVLRELGTEVQEHGAPGCFPLTLSGKSRPAGATRVSLPGSASSQFISGLLLSAPYFGGDVEINVEGELVSKPYLDMTTHVMSQFGVTAEHEGYSVFRVPGGQQYRGTSYAVEPDASAASYFFAAAVILGGSVTVEGLGSDSRQGDLDIVHIFRQMGAKVSQEPNRTTVTGGGPLQGVEVNMANLSDVAQTLAVVAPFASSPTRITGIGFIRNKETDRIGAVVRELGKLGIRAEEEPDGYTIYPGSPTGGAVTTYEDHRMAMSFALIGLKVPGVTILDPKCTSKTFPDYFDVLAKL